MLFIIQDGIFNMDTGTLVEKGTDTTGAVKLFNGEVLADISYVTQLHNASRYNLKTIKLTEIMNGANAVKSLLTSNFSALEEATWPEQEAGARAILGDEGNVKNEIALVMLQTPTAKSRAIAKVRQLAEADGVDEQAFAVRITANADTAHMLGNMSLLEQRAMESQVRLAKTLKELESIQVSYTALKPM